MTDSKMKAEVKMEKPSLTNSIKNDGDNTRNRNFIGGRGMHRGSLMGEYRGRFDNMAAPSQGGPILGPDMRLRNSKESQNDQRNSSGNDQKNMTGFPSSERNRDRRGGFRGGRGGGTTRGNDERIIEKLSAICGPTYELPSVEQKNELKKFTNRCRLFVGNITEGTSMQEFQNMFKEFGEVAEPYLNTEKAFGFIKLDYRENAEKARRALDGTTHNGRSIKVRFSSMGCTLKVKRLPMFVSNELLELAFGVFGDLERASVIVDERGKSTGEGIVEFCRKPSATMCLQKCTENSFFLTEKLCPVEVEMLKEDDLEDGLPDKSLPKKHPEFMRERSVGPRFSVAGTFEHEFGQRWKHLYELEKERREQLRTEMRLEMEKLEDQLEFARREHETEMLREQLRQREMEQERSKSDWQQRQLQRDQERRRYDEMVQRRQEQVHERMRQTAEDMKRRSQENRLFMQANELNSLLDQQEQAIWGGRDPNSGPAPAKKLPDTFPSYGALGVGAAAAAGGAGVPPTAGPGVPPASGPPHLWGHPPPPPHQLPQPSYPTPDNTNGNNSNLDRAANMGGFGAMDQGRGRNSPSSGFRGGRGGGPPGGFRPNRPARENDGGGGDYGKRPRMY